MRQGELLDSIGKKAEVTDAHEAIGEHMEEEAANELLGIEGHCLFSVSIFSIPVAKSD